METETMNSNQNQAQTDSAPEQAAQGNSSLQREYTFSFRKQTPDALAKSLGVDTKDIFDPKFLEQFELLDINDDKTSDMEKIKTLRRKPITTKLDMPEFILSIPKEDQEAAATVFENTVATYVKQAYVDAFEEIGDHSWPVVKRWLESRGSRAAKWDFDEDTFKKACAAFGNYCAEAIGIAEVGKKLEAVAKGRFTRNSIQRQTNKFDEDVINKLQQRLDEFMAWVEENDPENFDDWSPVYQCWSEALERHLRKPEKEVDLSQVL